MQHYSKIVSNAAKGLDTDPAPYFARACHYTEADLSDNWIHECDPDAEQGADVVGFFRLDNNEGYIDARLEGIRVERKGLPMAYFDRAATLMLFGKDAMDRIDAHQSEIEDERARAWA